MVVVIKSDLMESRGNSWNFENSNERVYAKLVDPTDEEIANAMAKANEQYEKMGWSKCFVSPPKVVKGV